MLEFRHRTLAALILSTAAIGFGTGASIAQVNLRAATEESFFNPPRVAVQHGYEYLAEKVPERTDGDVTVELYPGAVLGVDRDMLKSVASGTVDISVVTPGSAASLIPEVQVFSAAYLFESMDQFKKVVSDERVLTRLQEIVEERDLGFQLVAISLTGIRNFYNRVRDINELEDIAGLKMRVASSPTEHKVWSTLGALTVSLPPTDIYTSIQTGVVDGAESSLPALVANRYYEVAPKIALTNHQYSILFYVIGDDALDRVPEEHRSTVLEVMQEAADVQIEAAERLVQESEEALRSMPGVTVTEIDTAPFVEKLGPIQDEIAREYGVEDLLAIIRETE